MDPKKPSSTCHANVAAAVPRYLSTMAASVRGAAKKSEKTRKRGACKDEVKQENRWKEWTYRPTSTHANQFANT